MMLASILFTVIVQTTAVQQLQILNHWNGGFNGRFTITTEHNIHGWCAHIVFDQSISGIEIWKAKLVQTCDNKEFIVQNMPWDADVSSGSPLDIDLNGKTSGDISPRGRVFISGTSCSSCTSTVSGSGNGGSSSGSYHSTHSQTHQTDAPQHSTDNPITAAPSHTGSSSTKYDYGKALGLSILFYDAQRSGTLPANNPIPWRGDSAVHDSDGNVDLSGGWYDAGDHVKFNLPMSYSATVLLWGLEKWKDGYQAAGQLDMMYDMIRWPLEYFLKCWRPAQNEYYVQVGDGGPDHAFWGRPEDMTMARPAYKVTTSKPGSDVAGNTAAALAAGSIIFKTKDAAFSGKLLSAAKGLFKFAKDYKGIYSQSVGAAAPYYSSSEYKDELCVGAAWLYKATQDPQYLQDAKTFYQSGFPWALSWDDKKVSCQLLLYEITQDNIYKSDVEMFIKSWMPGGYGGLTYTPCGLAWRDQWGSLRYSANTAFVALMAAENGIGGDPYKTWALSQINYILGDNNKHMSYEIGFGSKYPVRPHHRGSSCPDKPAPCDHSNLSNPGPSPQLLKGALVGGPDSSDNYQDKREDYTKNEVACDYNAGFQSALAGLVHFAQKGQLPASPAAKC